MCLELTKLHERVERGTLPELAERFAKGPVRGELVLVIGGLTRAERRAFPVSPEDDLC